LPVIYIHIPSMTLWALRLACTPSTPVASFACKQSQHKEDQQSRS
jgi:hypothetical protein